MSPDHKTIPRYAIYANNIAVKCKCSVAPLGKKSGERTRESWEGNNNKQEVAGEIKKSTMNARELEGGMINRR